MHPSHWSAHHASPPASAAAVEVVSFPHVVPCGRKPTTSATVTLLGPPAEPGVRYATQAEPLATPTWNTFLKWKEMKGGEWEGYG